MAQLLNQEIFKFILVFLRIGSAIMLMPGFSASYVNMRQRLSIALAVSVVLVPFLNDQLPPQPSDLPDAIKMYLFEITYGVFFGLAMQILFSALSLCGNFIGQAIGFSNAQIFDPAFQTQSIVIETFLSVLALTVIDSYRLFPVASSLPVGDFSDYMSQTLNQSFIMGFKIGSPFIAFSLVFYVGMGLVSRLMPQLNIFFLSLPLQIYLGLGLLFITTPVMILWFIKYYEEGLLRFVR